jgi:precorrin-2/cobalt-factor-2 C20-methyltransferase
MTSLRPNSQDISQDVSQKNGSQSGTLYGIGVGANDPELLTIKGFRILRSVDILAFAAGRGGKSTVAERIASHYAKPEQRTMPLALPIKDSEVLRTAWQTAAIQLTRELRQGKSIAFIDAGDVSFYSAFTYIMAGVHNQDPEIPITIVPGICAPLAAAAAMKAPLTLGTDKLVVLNAGAEAVDVEQALEWAEVVVILNLQSRYAQIWELLRSRDLLKCSSVIAWLGSDQEFAPPQVWTELGEHPLLNLPTGALLIINRSLHF